LQTRLRFSGRNCNKSLTESSKHQLFLLDQVLRFDWRMTVDLAHYESITGRVIAAAIEVHKATGAGMLEKAYMPCVQLELQQRGLRFKAQQPISFVYKGVLLDMACRADLIVENVLVVELKAVAAILPIHEAQILTYMRLANCPVGLIINFNVPRLVDGVKRKVNARATPSNLGPTGLEHPERTDL
jgi:GxxExxY protein